MSMTARLSRRHCLWMDTDTQCEGERKIEYATSKNTDIGESMNTKKCVSSRLLILNVIVICSRVGGGDPRPPPRIAAGVAHDWYIFII